MKPSGWLVSLACAAWICAAPVLTAQEAPPVFGEELEVRVVNFEVVVTDRKGNRVSGLKPEDFRRTLRHPDHDGILTLDWLVAMYSWHGRHHVGHITSTRERMGW